jgi:predicted AlkP superfamily pyrophosphatase or phosphodiesterase
MVRLFSLVILLSFLSCGPKQELKTKKYQTRNVIIVMIDGPRYSETWGDPGRSNIPVRDSLATFGVLLTNFKNEGPTYTVPGHTAICTGNYQTILNNGTQLPDNPPIFQRWLKSTTDPYTKCCIIASKDKLHVLSNCLAADYQDQYRPYFDCGVNGDGTGGYRDDLTTFNTALDVMEDKQPRLMLIAFKDPDYFAHQSNYPMYIKSIRKTDEYVGAIWRAIQNSPNYKDKTTLIITNDHGRHPDGVSNGFVSHGDDCSGCRQIEFLALSPDFKQNVQLNSSYSQVDISATISELLHFSFPTGKGKVMWDLFR